MKSLFHAHWKSAADAAATWIRKRTYAVAATTLLFLLLLPRQATCQIPSPCCIELSLGLAQINASMVSTIGGGLSQIHSIENDMSRYQQQVLYPLQQITQTRSSLMQVWSSMRGMQNILNRPLQTATLPNPQQLESVLLSRDATRMSNLGTQYHQLYGSVPAANTAAPRDIDTIDISDAVAQDAMKRSMVYDQMADQELQAADQMQSAINQAAPGTAPMIEASAAAWLVKSQAYTQSALADLMRVNTIALANTSGGMKSRTASMNNVFQQTGAAMSR